MNVASVFLLLHASAALPQWPHCWSTQMRHWQHATHPVPPIKRHPPTHTFTHNQHHHTWKKILYLLVIESITYIFHEVFNQCMAPLLSWFLNKLLSKQILSMLSKQLHRFNQQRLFPCTCWELDKLWPVSLHHIIFFFFFTALHFHRLILQLSAGETGGSGGNDPKLAVKSLAGLYRIICCSLPFGLLKQTTRQSF